MEIRSIALDAHMLGALCTALGLRASADLFFKRAPGEKVIIAERTVAALRNHLRRSDLGVDAVEYFLGELTAEEEEGAA